VPVPMAVEGIRVVKEPWMRSFWERELLCLLVYEGGV